MSGAQGPRIRRRSRLLHLALAVVLPACVLAGACEKEERGPVDCGTAGPPSLPFPRTATTYLDQHVLPPVEELARYDVVVLDHEWAHRVPRTFFDEIRALNPGVRLLAYVNVVDYPEQLGTRDYWGDRYKLWQFDTATDSTFPAQWLATTQDGSRVSQWPHTVMANLTDQAPSLDGRIYADYAADWVVDSVWSTGVWDGIFLDVWGDRIFGADHDRWDIDLNGTDESEDQIYGVGGPWERGIDRAEVRMRQRMPGAVVVANGERTLRGGQLDGRVWESFADPEVRSAPLTDIDRYVEVSSGTGHRLPGLTITIDKRRTAPGTEQDFRRARFFLAATLLQNGYWAPMGIDYSELSYYDEMDGGGLGRGYLGQPLMANPCPAAMSQEFADGFGSTSEGVFRRDFDNGIVLLNTGTEPANITLERPYQRLTGTQDPATNNGQTVDEVTLVPQDGLVLLRSPE
ncbi:putative glycoside hydrolase [Rhodococcus sp. T2V]|uniref:putative glycoside hydrolase n=1 Tax=Rhodococcus sp. T2V TaxID=3034164 RepID=UPI0023E229C2|nr:putative glycoside hydrolase [Rhodococcus sp. T2V]MDF3303697.1 putative glycoside hydrolase [Rhodococcus sp. T2V]